VLPPPKRGLVIGQERALERFSPLEPVGNLSEFAARCRARSFDSVIEGRMDSVLNRTLLNSQWPLLREAGRHACTHDRK
jgi:hypothetical protein